MADERIATVAFFVRIGIAYANLIFVLAARRPDSVRNVDEEPDLLPVRPEFRADRRWRRGPDELVLPRACRRRVGAFRVRPSIGVKQHSRNRQGRREKRQILIAAGTRAALVRRDMLEIGDFSAQLREIRIAGNLQNV